MNRITPLVYRTLVPSFVLFSLLTSGWSADSDDVQQPTVTKPSAVTKPDEKSEKPADESPEVSLTPAMVKRFGITTYHVEPQIVHEPVIAPGTVALIPENILHVGTVLLGRVSAIHVHLGDVVKAGDALITIDSPELGLAQNDWLQKRTGIAVAEAEVSIAEQAHQRAQVLVKDNGISVAEAQRRAGDLLKAKSALTAALAAVQGAENTLRIHGMDHKAIETLEKISLVDTHLIIRAAIAGTVIASAVSLGEIARPETESLMTIADTTALIVIAHVPASQATSVRIGNPVRISSASAINATVTSLVNYMAPQIEAETRTRAVRIPVNSDQGLAVGSFVQVEISPTLTGDEQEKPIIAVPRSALFTINGATVVFVADEKEPGTYAMRKVAVAPALGSLVPIISGVEDDDEVVIHGGFIIKAEFGKAGIEDDDD